MSYTLKFDEDWLEYYNHLDGGLQGRTKKLLRKLKEGLDGRHLKHGLDFFVLEFGQYRMCYKKYEREKTKKLYFVGDHKEYEKWIGTK